MGATSRSRDAIIAMSFSEDCHLEYRILHMIAGAALKRRRNPILMGRVNSFVTGAIGATLLIRRAERRRLAPIKAGSLSNG